MCIIILYESDDDVCVCDGSRRKYITGDRPDQHAWMKKTNVVLYLYSHITWSQNHKTITLSRTLNKQRSKTTWLNTTGWLGQTQLELKRWIRCRSSYMCSYARRYSMRGRNFLEIWNVINTLHYCQRYGSRHYCGHAITFEHTRLPFL